MTVREDPAVPEFRKGMLVTVPEEGGHEVYEVESVCGCGSVRLMHSDGSKYGIYSPEGLRAEAKAR